MRDVIDENTIEGVDIVIGFDSGGPLGADNFVEARGDGWELTRWFFYDEWNEYYAQNFGEKLATNEEYRQKSLNGETDWKRVQDTYAPVAKELDEEVMENGGDIFALEEVCEELFDGIKKRVRKPTKVSDDDPDMNEFIEQKRTEIVAGE